MFCNRNNKTQNTQQNSTNHNDDDLNRRVLAAIARRDEIRKRTEAQRNTYTIKR